MSLFIYIKSLKKEFVISYKFGQVYCIIVSRPGPFTLCSLAA